MNSFYIYSDLKLLYCTFRRTCCSYVTTIAKHANWSGVKKLRKVHKQGNGCFIVYARYTNTSSYHEIAQTPSHNLPLSSSEKQKKMGEN